MRIEELFERDIHRPINGVVKADQLDDSSVWQELDEFVVTKELSRHINDLVAVLLSTIESEEMAADKNGVWVSGFFGCGKSHFIKVLSYLMENAEHSYSGEQRRAVDFFKDKIEDAMLYADLKKVVAATTETILFNIDTKADHRAGRDALLQVFLKVLNEKQGYSGDHPHIAHMERHLEEKGKLEVFQTAFKKASGAPWLDERDAWEFNRDEVVAALREALGQSEDSVEAWVDSAESNFSLTVENFAKWVKRYLDSTGSDRRIMFLVDEVGQFIANDTHLMLNLQTITEQLGTVCHGRAWVVVTSQEDLDAVLGDLKEHKQHDFSKIQGRFKTRLSLSSDNVDEVIKRRLLAKNAAAIAPLNAAYEGKHDILRNQLSFVKAGMTFKHYTDAEDFAACYPFAAYQFTLVQKVFESIRKAGATGLHLSRGERSTLDAFQSAAKQIGDQPIGALVPFYRFYPAVEGFLDTVVKKTINQAADNHALEAFDATLLKVLFLIRYIEELPGSVDNLVTLCVDEIDADRLKLRGKIETALLHLERETLIARNGDLYFFLTNEERDIGREIKNQAVPSGAEERELGKLIFEDILSDVRKHSYSVTGRDFAFTRLCDGHPVGNRLDGSLEVAIISPLNEHFGEFSNDQNCLMDTINHDGRVMVRLPDADTLGRELKTYLQTESYVKTKHTGSLPESTKRILRDRSEDNRTRRGRILTGLKTMLASANYFASGTKLTIGSGDPKNALGEAMEYLIQNAYPKMGYITHLRTNPKQEIQSMLRANDVEQMTLTENSPEANLQALNDLRGYVSLCALNNKQIVLHEMIEKRYGQRPYGWPELEVVLLVARLAVLKEINLVVSVAPLALADAYEHLISSSKQRKVIITKREAVGGDIIKKAQELGQDLFGQQGPGSESELYTALRNHLEAWNSKLGQYEPLAKTGEYPGLSEIQDSRNTLRKFVEETNSRIFLNRFVENKGELLKLSEDFSDLDGFYTNQKHSWEKLRKAAQTFAQNRHQLEPHVDAGPALARMEEILTLEKPYNYLQEVGALIHVVEAVNSEMVAQARVPAMARILGRLDCARSELDKVSADEALCSRATAELEKMLKAAAESNLSIAHIAQTAQAADAAFDRALSIIEQSQAKKPTAPPPRSRRVVVVNEMVSGGFIENEGEMNAFLDKLRSELKAALADNHRIQIK